MTTAARFTLTSLGVPVPITVTGAGAGEARASAQAAWGDLYSPEPGEVGLTFRVESSDRIPHFLDSLSSQATISGIEHLAGTHLMLHAAGLSRGGITIAAVAPSGTGKTTLSRAAAGALEYASDETVTITGAGEVIAHPKPLSIKMETGPKEQRSPASLGLTLAPERTRFGGVVLLDRREEPTEARFVDLTLTDAVTTAVSEVSYLGRFERPLTWLARALHGARRLVYHEAADAIGLLTSSHPVFTQGLATEFDHPFLADSAAEHGEWAAAAAQIPDAPGPRVELTEGVREYLIDYDTGSVLVFTSNDLRVVSPLAAAVLVAAAAPVPTAALAAYCEGLFGAPPAGDSTAVVRAAIAELLEQGVLRTISQP